MSAVSWLIAGVEKTTLEDLHPLDLHSATALCHLFREGPHQGSKSYREEKCIHWNMSYCDECIC